MKIIPISSNTPFINKSSQKVTNVKKFDFKDFLNESIDNIEGQIRKSEKLDADLAAGKIDNIHEAMIEAQKADITLNFALEIRSQVIDAYREIMRIQV